MNPVKFFKTLAFANLTLVIIAVSITAQFRKPELIVQTGHSYAVNAVASSSDGKLLASAGADGTLKLWDMAGGREVRSFSAPNGVFNAVAFSPNGKLLGVGTNGKGCQIFNVETGEMLDRYKTENSGGRAVAFSPDGKLFVCAGPPNGKISGDIELWDVDTGKISRFEKSDQVRDIAFSPDGKTIVVGKDDPTVELWDVKTQAKLKTLTGHTERVTTVAFSPDGQIVAGGDWKGNLKLWDVQTGNNLRSYDGKKTCENLEMKSTAFSPDGKFLAAACFGRIFLWNVATGSKVYQVEDGETLLDLAFTADGASLLSGGYENFKMRDAATGKELRTFKRNANSVGAIAFTADGKRLANASQSVRITDKNSFIRLWGADAGSEMRSFDAGDSAYAVALSPDGKILAQPGKDSSVILRDAASGQQIRQISFRSEFDYDYVRILTFSPDGKILAGSSKNTVRLWDTATGSELKTLPAYEDFVGQLVFSPDGKTLAASKSLEKIKLWNVAAGRELPTFKNYEGIVKAIAFSPDGKFIAAQNPEELTVLNIRTGVKIRSIPTGTEGQYESLAFSPDGKILAGGDTYDGHIILWDFQTGKKLRKLVGHKAIVTSIQFGANGKVLASSSEDATIKLWDTQNGTEMASLIAIGDSDWLIVTPDGLFDGSPKAWKELFWRFNGNTFNVTPVEAFFKEFYYPGLLGEILQGNPPSPPEKNLAQIDVRAPAVSIIAINRRDMRGNAAKTVTVSQPTVKLAIGIADNPNKPYNPKFTQTGGARDLRVFRNGSLVKIWNGSVFDLTEKDGCRQAPPTDKIPVRRTICEAEVQAVAGDNNFSAYVFNGDNVKSRDAELTVKGADTLKRRGKLYVLAIGVNEYAKSDYNLRYAIADVEGIGDAIKNQQTQLKNYDQTEIVELKNQTATKANILLALNLFGGATSSLPEGADAELKKIKKLQPEDALVIYYAGHGTASKNSFYLIPHDGFPLEKFADEKTRIEKIYASSISDAELQTALEPLDAGKVLMIIDACNSGQALESEEKRRGPMNSKGLAQLAYEKGMYILTAAQSRQAALEVSKLGHGLLTYALLEGLKNAEKNSDGNIIERKWFDYATLQVPQLQVTAMQTRSAENKVAPPSQKRSELAVANGDNTNLPPEKRGLQIPRIFYRRELEANPLIVAKP